ncbi:uncharacterized protein LOC129306179 isoform X1 [Prosopis cineraria]|uniref:uncharacterized protein LOC129306179 isoform X1 n=1 Tax=Prosopis cineraria TaxID=364024 RepID=UPI00240FFFAB|nr:uncharacterized protein LOC129306179 isoform X1 [Prosopis cineraria]
MVGSSSKVVLYSRTLLLLEPPMSVIVLLNLSSLYPKDSITCAKEEVVPFEYFFFLNTRWQLPSKGRQCNSQTNNCTNGKKFLNKLQETVLMQPLPRKHVSIPGSSNIFKEQRKRRRSGRGSGWNNEGHGEGMGVNLGDLGASIATVKETNKFSFNLLAASAHSGRDLPSLWKGKRQDWL